MKSIASVLLAIPLLAHDSPAQSDLRHRLVPITAPVRNAGVYHLGTGTWTRPGPGGPETSGAAAILYDNTCSAGYYSAFQLGARIFDEGRLPSPTSPVLPNAWGLGHDSEVGTQASYTIDGFQIGYCTLSPTPIGYTFRFYDAYVPCSAPTTPPTATFALTGLPGATGGGLTCWMLDIDLCASSQSFALQADADGLYNGTAGGAADSFGWSFELTATGAPSLFDGYMIAGGTVSLSSYQTCSGSDGTVFDQGTTSATYPANSDAIALGCATLAAGASPEIGSGMGTQDRFRIENAAPTADGCYWFGGNPSGNFYLQLYTANVTLPGPGPALSFCEPAAGGGLNCPCANPASGTGRGCDNSAATGGASLGAFGSATLASDTLGFITAGELAVTATTLVQGSATSGGVQFGQGVRCVSGTLKRLYTLAAAGGAILVPGPGAPSVSARSAALGDPIAGGSSRYYFAMYRDPVVLGGCPAIAIMNCTNAGSVLWN
jgi:hypothetical protein